MKERLVFIPDGAVWIRNWITDTFPQATSILDFYHASQYLYGFQKAIFQIPNKLDNEIPIELILPPYSDIEMMEHSRYRELWIAQKCSE